MQTNGEFNSLIVYTQVMYKRKLERRTKELAGQFPVVAILGPRQSGKTTLAKLCFPDYHYVNLENPSLRSFAIEDPEGFLQTHGRIEGVIFDEAQRVPDLFSYIQVLVDEKRRAGQFILTGSQNFHLNEQITQSLAGRVALLQLLPFSIGELEQSGVSFSHYAEALFKGGYPSVHTQGISPIDWYPNYIQTYIERDVRQLKNVFDLNLFQRFIRLCAGRIGQVINWTDLGRDCGIDHKTARVWASVLEASYVIYLLPPYYRNFSKRLVKSPKLYFYDTGIACSLLGISSPDDLQSHYLKGGLFESFVISELIKEASLHRGVSPFYFWRDHTGNEIDLIFETHSQPKALEIKSSQTISSDYFKTLEQWQSISNSAPDQCYLIYGGNEDEKRSLAQVRSWQKTSTVFEA